MTHATRLIETIEEPGLLSGSEVVIAYRNLLRDAAAEIKQLRAVLQQAQSCILGDTPEDCTPEEAREDTLAKIKEALA